MIVLSAATVVVVYLISTYIYFFISVSLIYSSTRKIAKMPGLSLFFLTLNIYDIVLFYPTTLSYFSFLAPSQAYDVGHAQKIDLNYFEYDSTPHIIISVIIVILWCIIVSIQLLNALLTTEISPQRLVSWSSVEPYTRLTLSFIKVYQALMLSFFVCLWIMLQL